MSSDDLTAHENRKVGRYGPPKELPMKNSEILATPNASLTSLQQQTRYLLGIATTPYLCGRCGGKHTKLEAARLALDDFNVEMLDTKVYVCPDTSDRITWILPMVDRPFWIARRLREHDVVELCGASAAELRPRAGLTGTIVHVYEDAKTAEVEFDERSGPISTRRTVTVPLRDLRCSGSGDRPAVGSKG